MKSAYISLQFIKFDPNLVDFNCFAGIKIFETNEKELVLEPAIRWAGNPNITLVLKVLSLQLTVQVRGT